MTRQMPNHYVDALETTGRGVVYPRQAPSRMPKRIISVFVPVRGTKRIIEREFIGEGGGEGDGIVAEGS